MLDEPGEGLRYGGGGVRGQGYTPPARVNSCSLLVEYIEAYTLRGARGERGALFDEAGERLRYQRGVRDTLCLIVVASTTTVEKQVGGDVLFKRREKRRRCVVR